LFGSKIKYYNYSLLGSLYKGRVWQSNTLQLAAKVDISYAMGTCALLDIHTYTYPWAGAYISDRVLIPIKYNGLANDPNNKFCTQKILLLLD